MNDSAAEVPADENNKTSDDAKTVLSFMQLLNPNERKTFIRNLIKKEAGLPIKSSPNTSFESERWALQLKPDIDEMMADKTRQLVLLYHRDDYPAWKLETIRLYLTNALRFIINNWDTPELDYAQFRENIEIQKRKDNTGIQIVWKDNASLYKLKPRRLTMKELAEEKDNIARPTSWRDKLNEFMDDPEIKVGDKLHLKSLDLSKLEQEELNELFAPEDFPFGLKHISNSELHIIKVS